MTDMRRTHKPVTEAYDPVSRSNKLLKPLKKALGPWPGFRSKAQRAGLRVRAFMALNSVVKAMVNENCLYNWPVIPPRNAAGTKTAMRTSVIPITAPVISCIAVWKRHER